MYTLCTIQCMQYTTNIFWKSVRERKKETVNEWARERENDSARAQRSKWLNEENKIRDGAEWVWSASTKKKSKMNEANSNKMWLTEWLTEDKKTKCAVCVCACYVQCYTANSVLSLLACLLARLCLYFFCIVLLFFCCWNMTAWMKKNYSDISNEIHFRRAVCRWNQQQQ